MRYSTVLAVGLALGLALGWVLWSAPTVPAVDAVEAPEPRTAATEASRETPVAPAELRGGPETDTRRELATESTTEPERRTETPRELFHEALRVYAEGGIRKGWQRLRSEELPVELLAEGLGEYEELLVERPFRIGMDLARRENAREEALADLKAGGAFVLLEQLDGGGVGPLPELVLDDERFADLFRRTSPPNSIGGIGALADLDAATTDGTTLTFPAGVYRLRSLMQGKGHTEYPRDVTIVGAGMDNTLLLFGDLHTRGKLRNFAIRDCTVFSESDSLVDLRSEPATTRFDHVRFVGFDRGSGSQSFFDAPGAVLHARACRFEGGYGRHPGYGQIFDVRSDALLARFDACTFREVRAELSSLRAGATVAFLQCELIDMLDQVEQAAESHKGVLLDSCFVSYFDGADHPPRRDLNELFPDWEKRIEGPR